MKRWYQDSGTGVFGALVLAVAVSASLPGAARGATPLEGFLPMVGMGLTNEFQDSNSVEATFFISQPSNRPGGRALGVGTGAYYDIALLDTGAATHILTAEAYAGFDIDNEGFDGTNIQQVGGATGVVDLLISDPLGVYAGPLSGRTSTGNRISMNPNTMRGQTSFAVLSGDENWTLPNIIGMPIAAHHKVSIRNDQPQIFQHQGRTVRSPNITFGELGSGGDGILRRSNLELKPGIGFIQGPIYVQSLDFGNILDPDFSFHENPQSPSVIENGGLFLEADFVRGDYRLDDKEFLFDTGASLTVVSEQTAARLGFDAVLDTPDFMLQVEGSGGISGNIPGFYVDQFRLDTVGGSFVLQNVPVAVLDVTSPNDPGNIVDGIIGMNLFAGRNLVIDAIPQVGQGGNSPSLYISDPVTSARSWAATAATANWGTASSWSAAGQPGELWDVEVANAAGVDQRAVVATNSTVFRATVAGAAGKQMQLRVASGATLTTFADVLVEAGGDVQLAGGRIDAQYVQVDGGTLSGEGEIFVGSGPIHSAVRNTGGRIAPGGVDGDVVGRLSIIGDLSNEADGTLSFDLAGTVAGSSYDQIETDRFAFLSGTLEVSLADIGSGLYAPAVGSSYTLITTGEGRQGTFDNLVLPRGYEWSVDYSTFGVTLQVLGLAALTGDLNGDGLLDGLDVNLITAATSQGSSATVYDLNSDGRVDALDIEYWITQEKGTLLGDANLDGHVNDLDLVVWSANQFAIGNSWTDGDFNGDGFIDGHDFSIWNANKFRSASGLASVPEPGSLMGLAAGLVGVMTLRRRRLS